MKKGIVRVLCGILAAQLILPQGVYSVKAEEVTDQAAEMTVESPEDTQTEDLQQEKVSQSTLSVTLHHASVLERKQSFRVTLEGTSYEKELVLDPQNNRTEDSVVFKELDDGTYTLRIVAPGFAVYEQENVAEGTR